MNNKIVGYKFIKKSLYSKIKNYLFGNQKIENSTTAITFEFTDLLSKGRVAANTRNFTLMYDLNKEIILKLEDHKNKLEINDFYKLLVELTWLAGQIGNHSIQCDFIEHILELPNELIGYLNMTEDTWGAIGLLSYYGYRSEFDDAIKDTSKIDKEFNRLIKSLIGREYKDFIEKGYAFTR